MLPLLLLFLCISFLIAYELTAYIYLPIKRMMHTLSVVKMEKDGAKDFQSEMDYFYTIYELTASRNHDLEEIFSLVQPDIRQKVLQSMLNGKVEEGPEFERLLKNFQIILDEKSRYWVLVLQLLSREYETLNEVEGEIYSSMAFHVLQKLIPPFVEQKMVRGADGAIGLLLISDLAMTDAEMEVLLERMKSHYREETKDAPFVSLISSAYSCDTMETLSNAFDLARQQTMYLRYLKKDENGKRAREAVETLKMDAYHNCFSVHFKQIASEVRKGNYEKAKGKLSGSVKDLFELLSLNGEPAGEVQKLCVWAVELFLEEFGSLGYYEGLLKKYGEGKMALPDMDQDMESQQGFLYAALSEMLLSVIAMQKKCSNKYVDAAKEYIDQNCCDYALSLESVARHVGIAPAYLSRLFGETQNVGFVDYLNMQRIKCAKVLLCTTQLPIKEIGFKTGFSSVQNYTRVFKKMEGVTPKQYREKEKSRKESWEK